MIRPPNRKAQPAPIVEPIENTAIASVSRSRGNRSVSIDVAAGDRAASPAPTPTRAVSRCQKFCAVPHSAVEMDQIETPLKKTQRRLKRSLTAPATSPNRQKVMANGKTLTDPDCVSEMHKPALKSEELREGKKGVRKCRSRGVR